MVAFVDESLMHKEVGIVPGAVENFEFVASFCVEGGKAFTHAILHVKESGHVTFGVIGKIPEGDEGEGGPLRYSEGDLILPRHDVGNCPHEVLEVEAHSVEGEGGISVCLGEKN